MICLDFQRINSKLVKKGYIRLDDSDKLNIETGKEYIVHGIFFRENTPWYYIYECESEDYPVVAFYEFFEVIDERFSQFWQLSHYISAGNKNCCEIGFNEWAKDRSLYEKLLDEDPEAINLFEKYRQQVEQEFVD